MSIFSAIMDKIFHHSSVGAAARGAGVAATSAPPPTPVSSQPAAPAAAAAPSPAAAPQPQTVDVEAVLTQMAAEKGGGGNWRTSIVDLLKLLDLDSSLTARKSLAQELNVHVGSDGTAEENLALHHAVMEKLAENGGKVPENLKQGA